MPGMANDTRIELRLPTDLLARIDEARGLASRAAFIRNLLEDRVSPVTAAPDPVSEEAPVAAVRATESRERPAPPRGQPKAQRRQKAEDAMSAALARQQALNKSKGI